jgi:hypothetical protein
MPAWYYGSYCLCVRAMTHFHYLFLSYPIHKGLYPSINNKIDTYRVSVSKTGEKIGSYLNALVAYLDINLNLK